MILAIKGHLTGGDIAIMIVGGIVGAALALLAFWWKSAAWREARASKKSPPAEVSYI